MTDRIPANTAFSPGTYLRCQRERAGLSIGDVRLMLCMLKLVGQNRVWPNAASVDAMLADIEAGRRVITLPQLHSLALLFPLSPETFRKLHHLPARQRETVDG